MSEDSQNGNPGSEQTPLDIQESEKIICEECSHYSDCPRMKGVDFCHGRQKWLKDRSGKDTKREE